jgi:hydroxyacylglutathione hydrolase
LTFELAGQWGGGEVWRITCGEFPSNAYLCSTGGGSCVLIDGGLDPHAIDRAMQSLGMVPTGVFCTHGHFDHAGAGAYFQKKYGCPVYLHREDQRLLRAANFFLMAFKLSARVEFPDNITAVSSGDSVDVAGYTLIFHGAPGHTDGSCVIELGSALFTGDTVYARGVGLSRLPGERPEVLRDSIVALWPLLTANRVLYPGHGGCINGAELRTSNRALLDFLRLDHSPAESDKQLMNKRS